MVALYTCQACLDDRHGECELGHPVPPGVYGGSLCQCPCRRDPHWNNPERVHDELQQIVKNLIDFEKLSKNIPYDPNKDYHRLPISKVPEVPNGTTRRRMGKKKMQLRGRKKRSL